MMLHCDTVQRSGRLDEGWVPVFVSYVRTCHRGRLKHFQTDVCFLVIFFCGLCETGMAWYSFSDGKCFLEA